MQVGGAARERRKKRREEEEGTETYNADSAAHTWTSRTHVLHTLLVEHLNHISRLPAIHHSHRQKRMQEMCRNCMATCTTTHKQAHERSQSSQHTLKTGRQRAGGSILSLRTITNQLPCALLSAHINCTYGDSLICSAANCSGCSAKLHSHKTEINNAMIT